MLSQGQVESVLREAGIDLGKTQEFTRRGDLEGELGQQKLFRELTGRSPGMGQLGVFDPAKAAAEAGERTRQLLTQQRAEEESLFGQFQTAITGQEKLPAMYTRIAGELGMPTQQESVQKLRNAILDLEGRLEAIPEAVQQRLRQAGELYTTGTRTLFEAARTTPVIRDISATGRELEREAGQLAASQQALGTRMGLETTQMEKELLPLKQRLDAFGQRAARELTGYTSANQMELDTLMQKLQMEQQLTLAEQQRAHDLAKLERDYELQAQQLKTDVVTAGGRIKLINTQTGAMIADLGASKTAGAGTAGERESAANKAQLTQDVKSYAGLSDVINLYSDKLSLADIKNIYDRTSPFGPAKESGEQIREMYRQAQRSYGTTEFIPKQTGTTGLRSAGGY